MAILSDIITKEKWLCPGQGPGPGNGPFHSQVTVVTTSVIGQLQMSSFLEAPRLANMYRDKCMDPSRSFPKYRDDLGGHRDRFGGCRDRFGGYRDRKGCHRIEIGIPRLFSRISRRFFLGNMKDLAFHRKQSPTILNQGWGLFQVIQTTNTHGRHTCMYG